MRGRRGALPVQKRIVLERAGIVNPESIEDYILYDGFQALGKALTQMTPAEVIAEVDKSGLAGARRRRFSHRAEVEVRRQHAGIIPST